MEKCIDRVSLFTEIGISLIGEKDITKLLEKIVNFTKKITGCDGATLYLYDEKTNSLKFSVVQTESLNISMSGSSVNWSSLNLFFEDGRVNREMVAVVCALDKRLVNIDDVYTTKEYNFEGTKRFDKSNNYRSRSMLVVPILDYESNLVGVLQLINKLTPSKDVRAFNKLDEATALSMASQAGVSIVNRYLIDDLEKLLESFIVTIGKAIDTKSKYTGDHVRRVAKIALLIAGELNSDNQKFKDINYTQDELYKIKISAWMHDIGKITTPEYIMDKSTKLETIFDRIELVESRFEVAKRDLEIEFLKGKISKEKFEDNLILLESDLEFLKKANIGGEFMSRADISRVELIYKRGLISQNEMSNLQIAKGTLSIEERDKINEHAYVGLEMLQGLHLPKKLKDLPNIAGNHHEKLNGKGYPRGLSEKDLTINDRILCIADIFEALTAADRPYKTPKKLSEVFRILSFMVQARELDSDLVRFFYDSKAYLKYAKDELQDNQLDEVVLDF
jgi:HD-GYP domain-containing protein (c-di-GMP phosphodiesterase class II)